MKKHIFALHWSKSISGLALFSSNLFLFRNCTTTVTLHIQQNRKTWRECACGEETGIVYALEYTLYAQFHTSPLTVAPVGKENHHLCSAKQGFRRKTQSFCLLYFFSFHWLKELCNILSNVQYFNIFYLVKLCFCHPFSESCLKSLWQKLPCTLLPVCQI